MAKDRVIFHIDINHCYAQIEEMKFPALREVPMAVGGHEEKRHGIILAKNDPAKKFDIRTGESLREAREKCPDLLQISDFICIPLHDIKQEFFPCWALRIRIIFDV